MFDVFIDTPKFVNFFSKEFRKEVSYEDTPERPFTYAT